MKELEESDAGEEAVVGAVCRQLLRAAGLAPEQIGRIGTLLVFHPLDLDARAEIVALSGKRVVEEYRLRVERIAPAVILTILKQGCPQASGRDPMNTSLATCLAAPLSRLPPNPPMLLSRCLADLCFSVLLWRHDPFLPRGVMGDPCNREIYLRQPVAFPGDHATLPYLLPSCGDITLIPMLPN